MPRTVIGCAAVAVLAIGCGNGEAFAQSSEGSSDNNASDSPNALATGNDSLKLTIAGQANRAVLFYDDGRETGAIHVDNDNSSTRLRFAAESTTFDALVLGAVIEVEFQSNPSNLVSQDDQRDVGSNTFDERRFEAYVKSDTWGNLLLGQGSTASDGSAEVDLSGTGVAGYSDVDDMANAPPGARSATRPPPGRRAPRPVRTRPPATGRATGGQRAGLVQCDHIGIAQGLQRLTRAGQDARRYRPDSDLVTRELRAPRHASPDLHGERAEPAERGAPPGVLE